MRLGFFQGHFSGILTGAGLQFALGVCSSGSCVDYLFKLLCNGWYQAFHSVLAFPSQAMLGGSALLLSLLALRTFSRSWLAWALSQNVATMSGLLLYSLSIQLKLFGANVLWSQRSVVQLLRVFPCNFLHSKRCRLIRLRRKNMDGRVSNMGPRGKACACCTPIGGRGRRLPSLSVLLCSLLVALLRLFVWCFGPE